MSSESSTGTGIGSLGFPIAAVFSYMKWHGLWLAVLHGICGWAYVVYYLIQYGCPIKFH